MAIGNTVGNRLFGKFITDEAGDGVKLKPARILKGAGMAALAGLLGASAGAFSCYPFGIALLAAGDRYVPEIFAGLLLSALFNRGLAIPAAVVYTVTIMLRIAANRLIGDISTTQSAQTSKTAQSSKTAKTVQSAMTAKTVQSAMTAQSAKTAQTANPLQPAQPRKKTQPSKMTRTAKTDSAKRAAAQPSGQAAAKQPLRERIISSVKSGTAVFGESILLRCAVSCFAAFVFGLYRLISGGFLYYDLFGLVLGFLVCPLLTLGMSMLFTRDERYLRYAEAGAAVMMFVVVFALRDFELLGFSPAFIAAIAASLWAAAGGGALKGCAAGLIAGIACGTGFPAVGAVGLVEISSAPIIAAAAGLIGGLFWKLSRVFAAAAVCIASLILGVSADGFGVLQTILPDTLGAVMIFMPLSYYGLLPRLPVFAQPPADSVGEAAVIMEKKQRDTMLRMNSLSEALGRLSDVIYTLSDRLRRPGIIDLKQLCDSSFDKYCSRCSLASLCLERECTSTLDAQSKITTELYTKGRIELDSVPGYLRERCYNIGNITSEINLETAALVEKLIRSDKTEAFALDYESLSKLLCESIAGNDAEYRVDAELTGKLCRSLKYMDMSKARALCYGSRRKQVIVSGVELAELRLGADEIRRAVENTLHTRLAKPKFSIDGNSVEVSMSARRRFSVENARATSVKESESANGDTAIMFETREDYFYSLISDGMGSGREAAVTSKLCGIFVEQLLSGGNGKAVTLEMLNGFIRSRGNECSATVDLAEIDLITGQACFVKSGAAPSFVLRNGNLYKLQSKTVPIGIMPALDAEQIKFDLMEGDIIIMLSDGVAQSLEDGVWLANLLTYEWEENLQLMAEKIIDNAALNNKRSDDMTAALVRVSEYGEDEN